MSLIATNDTVSSLHLGFSKLEMADMLAKDILLEKEILGDSGQQELCDMECEILDLIKRKKAKSANFIRLKFADKWAPLSTEQKQRAIAEEHQKEADKRGNRTKREKDYMKWNTHRTLTHNAPITEHRGMLAGSITTRGGDINTPRGVSLCIDIVAGSNHAAIIVQDERSRSVYTWGISSLGRLGQGGGEHTFADNSYPTIVEELKGSDVTDMSLGQSHSAAVTRGGTLFLWGAGSSGQLGFGKMSDGKEFFCTIPTRLLIPSCKVVSVSCGACHTACIGRSGELYVWGCGDGGRLGLGRDRMSTQDTPTLVHSLCHERISDINCGTSTTLALTHTENIGTNSRTSVKRIAGGRLFVAGPKNVLGASFPSFSELECLKQKPVVIKSIGAGYSHQCFVSESGELYCWGHNLHGCCGQEESRTRFISEPVKIDW